MKFDLRARISCFLHVATEVQLYQKHLLKTTTDWRNCSSLYLKPITLHRCIAGDLNFRSINWTNWTTTHGEKSIDGTFIETVRDCFYHQHIEEPTRRRGNNPSLLDLVFTDEQMQVSEILHRHPFREKQS